MIGVGSVPGSVIGSVIGSVTGWAWAGGGRAYTPPAPCNGRPPRWRAARVPCEDAAGSSDRSRKEAGVGGSIYRGAGGIGPSPEYRGAAAENAGETAAK